MANFVFVKNMKIEVVAKRPHMGPNMRHDDPETAYSRWGKFLPQEAHVALLLEEGKHKKEIAALLHVSYERARQLEMRVQRVLRTAKNLQEGGETV